jgi:hypothetical protein
MSSTMMAQCVHQEEPMEKLVQVIFHVIAKVIWNAMTIFVGKNFYFFIF